MTPYYAPAPGGDRTQYNTQQYYNNYAYAPNQAPPHPEQTVAYNNGYYNNQAPPQGYSAGGHEGWNVSFASPPAPTLNEVYSEFGQGTSPLSSNNNTPNTANGVSFDLLDDSAPPTAMTPAHHNDLQTAAYLAAQDSNGDRTTSSPKSSPSNAVVTTDDIPSEIVAAQERAFADCKQRHLQSRNAGGGSTSQAMVPHNPAFVIPESSNPSGSDAVHPNREVWRHTRGNKTAAGAAGGAIVGGIVFGPAFPVGMLLGGAAGGYATNKMSKHGERRAQRKWEETNYQRGAQNSLAVTSNATMV